jgi:hypothetical protein
VNERDGHGGQRRRTGRGVRDGEVVGGPGARHHDARVQTGEQGEHRHQHGHAGRDEPREVAAVPQRLACGHQRERADQADHAGQGAAAGGERRPDGKRCQKHGDGKGAAAGRPACPFTQVLRRPHGQPGGPVQQAQQRERDPEAEPVPGEHGAGRAGEVASGVQRDPCQRPAQHEPDQQRDQEAAPDHRQAPAGARPRRLRAVAELEGHPAHDQRAEQQQNRQVERREDRGVPGGERPEHRGDGDHEPDHVAVPDRADARDRCALLVLGPAEPAVQCADPEVEAVEDEEARPEHGDEDEPQHGEVHGIPLQ